MSDADWDESIYGWEPKRSSDAHGVEVSDLRLVANAAGDESARPVRWLAEPPIGSVIRFEKQYKTGGPVYTYVATRVNLQVGSRHLDPWYITGNVRTGPVMSWESLREFIGNNKCEIATAWFDVPSAIGEDAVGERIDPSEYVELFWPNADAKTLSDPDSDRPWED